MTAGDYYYPMVRHSCGEEYGAGRQRQIHGARVDRGSRRLHAVFDAKYHYDFWRPITRSATVPSTTTRDRRDATWQPIANTRCTPNTRARTASAARHRVRHRVRAGSADIPESHHDLTAAGRHAPLDNVGLCDEVAMARIYAGFSYRSRPRDRTGGGGSASMW
jgi:hypothetical protein